MQDIIIATVKSGGRPDPEFPNAHNYRVTLRYQGRSMTVPFHTGEAWTREPNAGEVLKCLLSDASTVENVRSFEEWCEELGFDTDSRRAERVYRACIRQTDQLRHLLGDRYQEVLWGADQEEAARELTGQEEA